MKKLIFILLLFICFCASAQNTVSLPAGTTFYIPSFRYQGLASDTLKIPWIYSGTGYNAWYTGTYINKYFLRKIDANLTGPITSIGNATTINNINGITPTYYDPTSSIQAQLNNKAPKASPAFTGITNIGGTFIVGYSADYDIQVGTETGNHGIIIRSGTTGIGKLSFDNGFNGDGTGRIWYDQSAKTMKFYTSTNGTNSFLALTIDGSQNATFTGNVNIGTGIINNQIIVNGINSGTASGSSVNLQNNGVTSIAFGNKSKVMGGVYDATPVIFGSTDILVAPAGTVKYTLGTSLFTSLNNITAPSFITSGGLSSQFVMGDGSLNSTAGFSNPMTTLGDIIYGGASGVPTRLAGNTTTTKMFITQTGTGSVSAAPVYYDLFGGAQTWSASQLFNGGIAVNTSNVSFTNTGNVGSITAGTLTTGHTYTLPDITGTFAMTSDITYATTTATDANITISAARTFVTLPVITASRTLSIPSASTFSGKPIIIDNTNTSGTFTWSFTGAIVKDAAGNTLTTLTNGVVYQLLSNGTNFIKIN